jgi:hypothetical protein
VCSSCWSAVLTSSTLRGGPGARLETWFPERGRATDGEGRSRSPERPLEKAGLAEWALRVASAAVSAHSGWAQTATRRLSTAWTANATPAPTNQEKAAASDEPSSTSASASTAPTIVAPMAIGL